MRSRKNTTELFTTFLQLDTDKAIGWKIDGRLRRSILNSQASLSSANNSEDYWVEYWYKKWQKNPKCLAKEHLSAYLQETCYWVAYKTVKNFSSPQYTLSDCFQMTIASVDIDKVLKGFKPQMGFTLKNYGNAVFSGKLKELLRQRQEIDISTNWKLLRRLTQKRLIESLENFGMSSKMVECYTLAWKCYQTLYTPTQRNKFCKLRRPQLKTWESIAALYNSQRLTELSSSAPECSAEVIEKWMLACAKAVRAYFYPNSISLNLPKGDSEVSRELIDYLPDSKQESPISQVLIQEEQLYRQAQRDRISAVLIAGIEELNEESRKIIQLYYSAKFNQQEIGKKLGIKQYNVSRRLTKVKKALLLKLATHCKESLHISLNPTALDYMSTLVEKWLKIKFNR